MSDEQIIPNAVGRLDDVVDAIREGRIDDACTLLDSEAKRRSGKVEAIEAELQRERDALCEVEEFRFELGSVMLDRIEMFRRACGWKGQE
ncbi:hypothetical protein GC170_14565 [bacterium]|nr:hypothetical protein [bacterium]